MKYLILAAAFAALMSLPGAAQADQGQSTPMPTYEQESHDGPFGDSGHSCPTEKPPTS